MGMEKRMKGAGQRKDGWNGEGLPDHFIIPTTSGLPGRKCASLAHHPQKRRTSDSPPRTVKIHLIWLTFVTLSIAEPSRDR